MNVFVYGYYGRGNLGDDLFIPSLNVLFSKVFSDSPVATETATEHSRSGNADAFAVTEAGVSGAVVRFKEITVYYLHINDELPAAKPSLIIVGGGDVLNEYFMSPLKKNVFPRFPGVPRYAVGVGGDPRYFSDFNGVWSRNSMPGALFCPDLVFLPSIWRAAPPALARRKSSVKFTSPSRRQLNDSIQNLHHIICQPQNERGLLVSLIPVFTPKFLVTLSTLLFRLAPSFSHITFVVFSEEQKADNNDHPAIKKVCTQLAKQTGQRLVLNVKTIRYPVDFSTYSEAVGVFKNHSAAICMRFHAHVLSVIAEIPFISLATSKKCTQFMSENRIPHFKIGTLADGTPDNFSFQQAEILLRSSMNSGVYIKIKKTIIDLWKSAILTFNFDTTPVPDTCPTVPLTTHAIVSEVKKFLETNYGTSEIKEGTIPDAVTFALYLITSKTESPYYYGFIENTRRDPNSFEASIQYILERERRGLNISFINQTDCWGKHRYGWEWVCDNIKTNLVGSGGIRCDLFVDRTFMWMRRTLEYDGTIPYTVPWIGFVHHPPCGGLKVPNSLENMLMQKSFLESLTTCKKLIVFSNYVGNYIREKTGFESICVIKHPATAILPDTTFSLDKFIEAKKVAQIGSWLRDEFAVFEVATELVPRGYSFHSIGGTQIKNISASVNVEFCGPCSSITNLEEKISESIMEKIKLVTCHQKLSNVDFDNIFIDHVVFLKMMDCSAINTVLECIMHKTPVAINKHPAVVEYLGEEYPLYYDDITDAVYKISSNELIAAAHEHLKNMKTDDLSITAFIDSVRKIGENTL